MNIARKFLASIRPAVRRNAVLLSTVQILSLLAPMPVAVATGLTLLPSGSVQAQTVEEVVVTARRKEENLQDVPIAITAYGDQYLVENNIQDLDEMQQHAPSLGVSPAGSSTNDPIISLRGQRPSETLITLDPAVPLYFADIPLTPTYGTNLTMYDLGNVQVLKGPQGTLFGKNSTGGAVLFTPKKPGDVFGGYVQFQAGDYSLMGLEGAVDLPATDWLRFRISGKQLDRDGYQENIADNEYKGLDYWDEHSRALRFTMDMDLGDRISNLFVVDWSENNMRARVPTPVAFNPSAYDGNSRVINTPPFGDLTYNQACPFCDNIRRFYNSNQLAAFGGNNYGLYYDAIEDASKRHWTEIKTDYNAQEAVENIIVSNTTSFEISDSVSIKNILGYRKLEYEACFDTDGTDIAIAGCRTNGGPFAPGSTNPIGNPNTKLLGLTTNHGDYDPKLVESEQFSEEIQLLITAFDDRLDLIVGATYFEMEASEDNPVQLTAVDPRRDYGEAENVAYGIFTEGTFQFTEWYALTLGARNTWDKRELTVGHTQGFDDEVCRVQTGGDTTPGLPIDQCSRTVSEDFSAPTWRMIHTFTPYDGLMVYASVATGYRTGGFNLRGQNTETLQPFNEETVLSYELGAKIDTQFDSGVAMRTNIALYKQDYDDIQKTTSCQSCSSFATETINASKATIQGGELEWMIAPFESLEFNLSYSYVDAGYDDWTQTLTLTNNTFGFTETIEEDISYRDFTYIPVHSGTASLKYTLPLPVEIGDISFRISYYAQSEMLIDDKVDEYNIVVGAADGYNPAVNPPFDNDQLNDARYAESYEIYNYRIQWSNIFMSELDFAVWMKNAKNETYVTGGLNVVGSLGIAAETYGPPRTIGASLRYQF